MTIDKTGFMDFSQFLQEQLNPSTLDRWWEELKEIEGMDEERIGKTLRGLDESRNEWRQIRIYGWRNECI